MSLLSRLLRTAGAYAHSACGCAAYRLGWHGIARRRFERVLLLRGADFRAYVHLGRIAFDLGDYSAWRREFEHARRTDPTRFARLRHAIELFEPRLAGTPYERASADEGFEATDARATWRAVHPFAADQQHGRAQPGRPHHGRGGRDGFGHGTDLPLAPGFDPLLPGQPYEGDDAMRDELDRDPLDPNGIDQHLADRKETDPNRGGHNQSGRNHKPAEQSLPDASLNRDDFASASERRRFQLRRPIDRHEIARCDLDDLARRLSG